MGMATPQEIAAFDQRLAEQALGEAPYPADFETVLTEHAASKQRQTAAALAAPDADLLHVGALAVPQLRAIVGPFKEWFDALKTDLRDRVLTAHGFQVRNQALKEELNRRVENDWYGPHQRTLEQAAQRYLFHVQEPTIPDAARSAANTVADELRRLTPRHGLPRVAQVLRDAATSGDHGTARALIPHLKSAYERADSGYQTHEMLGLIAKASTVTREWHQDFGERQLKEVQVYQSQLDMAKRDAIENAGDLDVPGSVFTQRISIDSNPQTPMLDRLIRDPAPNQ